MNKKNRKGFTIVELVIVIAVIGILATVLVPTFSSIITDANTSKALQGARNAYTIYVKDHAARTDYDGAEDVYVTFDGKVFKVTNGSMGKAPLTETEVTAIPADAIKVNNQGKCEDCPHS